MQNPANYAVGTVKDIRIPGQQHYNDLNDIVVTTRYQNRTAFPLYISGRDGVRFRSVPTNRYNVVDEFRIYVTYTASAEVIRNAGNSLNESPNSGRVHDKILRAMKRAYTNGVNSGRDISWTVEYVVTEKQLRDCGGRLYLGDLDLLIETEQVRPMTHPYSQYGTERRRLESLMPSCTKNTLAFMFKAVDNSGSRMYADRYINIGGMVYRIAVEKDDAYATGIHVIGRKEIVMGDGELHTTNEMESRFFTFEEADKNFGLRLTAEEAKVAGPLVEHLREQAAVQVARDKLEASREERSLQLLRNEQQRQKMELDLELNEGKSLMEWSKIVAGVFAGVVTIITIWQKLAAK